MGNSIRGNEKNNYMDGRGCVISHTQNTFLLKCKKMPFRKNFYM